MGLPERASGTPAPESPPRPRPPVDPNPLHVSRMLWLLLLGSALFLAGVQVYVSRIEKAASPLQTDLADQPLIGVESPILPLKARDLALRWDSVPGAYQYLLRIHSVQGIPVVDPMIEWGTNWRPSQEVLPGFGVGSYRWTVEAVDSSGRVLARSLPTEFELQ